MKILKQPNITGQASPSRRKFILFGSLASFAVLTFSFFRFKPLKQEAKTIKMLSREGKLVEIDVSKIQKSGNKISDRELQKWVKH